MNLRYVSAVKSLSLVTKYAEQTEEAEKQLLNEILSIDNIKIGGQ